MKEERKEKREKKNEKEDIGRNVKTKQKQNKE